MIRRPAAELAPGDVFTRERKEADSFKSTSHYVLAGRLEDLLGGLLVVVYGRSGCVVAGAVASAEAAPAVVVPALAALTAVVATVPAVIAPTVVIPAVSATVVAAVPAVVAPAVATVSARPALRLGIAFGLLGEGAHGKAHLAGLGVYFEELHVDLVAY